MAVEQISASTMEAVEKSIPKFSEKVLKPRPISIDSVTPIKPPTMQIKIASIKNCCKYIGLFCSDSHPDADFLGSFGYRNQHNVHHADAADNQGNDRNACN